MSYALDNLLGEVKNVTCLWNRFTTWWRALLILHRRCGEAPIRRHPRRANHSYRRRYGLKQYILLAHMRVAKTAAALNMMQRSEQDPVGDQKLRLAT